jgi:amino acid transporter
VWTSRLSYNQGEHVNNFGLSFPAGLGMPMAFVVVAAILACFAVGYAELSRAVKGTGAFYTYISGAA